MKLLHCNIEKGKYIDKLIAYIKEQDFDILSLQEIARGSLSYSGIDCYATLINRLGYYGKCTKTFGIIGENDTYEGNAVLWKSSHMLVNSHVVWLKKYEDIVELNQSTFSEVSRNALVVELESNGKTYIIISTHLAWGPTPVDEPYKVKEGRILVDNVKTLSSPYILTGDFNLTPDSQVVSWLSEVGNNLISKNNIKNTLNPRIHRAKHLFPQGLAVDYIFTHPAVTIHSFKVIENADISDHFGLYLEFGL